MQVPDFNREIIGIIDLKDADLGSLLKQSRNASLVTAVKAFADQMFVGA